MLKTVRVLAGKLFPLLEAVVFMDSREEENLQRTLAISKVPTVSILAAIMGIPVYICFEFRNEKDLVRSTSLRDLRVLRLGLSRTSLKSSLTSLSM